MFKGVILFKNKTGNFFQSFPKKIAKRKDVSPHKHPLMDSLPRVKVFEKRKRTPFPLM